MWLTNQTHFTFIQFCLSLIWLETKLDSLVLLPVIIVILLFVSFFYRYFPAFLASPFYCKHQIDILTSGKVFLSDILYNQNAMFYFMEVSTFCKFIVMWFRLSTNLKVEGLKEMIVNQVFISFSVSRTRRNSTYAGVLVNSG